MHTFHFLFRSRIWLFLALISLFSNALVPSASAAIRVWDGGDLFGSSYWMSAGNWTLRGAPIEGDALTFPANVARLLNTNNFPAATGFDHITYSGAGYNQYGNSLYLTNGINVTHGVGTTTVRFPIVLGEYQTFNVTDPSANLTLAGPLNLGTKWVTFTGAGDIQVSGGISRGSIIGGVPIIQDGPGTTFLTASNNFSGGAIMIKQGTLTAAHTYALGPLGFEVAGVYVSNVATFALSGSITAQKTPVILSGSLSNALSTSHLTGQITLAGPNATIGAADFLILNGPVVGPNGFTKTGPGTVILAGTNTFAGSTTVNAGFLQADGMQPATPIFLNGGGLSGSNRVGAITSLSPGGTIYPGSLFFTAGTATLSCGDLSLNPASTCVFEIARQGTALQNDQINVNGVVDLGSSSLSIRFRPVNPLPGDSFIVINNDGTDPITGTFAGFPEGAVTNILAAGRVQISYVGGDGNDVALTVLPFPRTWTGAGIDNNWLTPNNWSNQTLPNPGDDLIFPAGASRLANNNNYAANTIFNSISFTGSNYVLGGNALVLKAGLTAAQPSGSATVAMPIQLAASQEIIVSAGAVLNLTTNIDTNGRELTFANEGDLRVSGVITGSGHVAKTGSGLALLSRTNTYTGNTDIRSGTVQISSGGAFGGAVSGTTVRSGALLSVNPGLTIPEPLTLSGTLQHNSTASGPGSWTGPIELQGAACAIEVQVSPLTISGVITGSGSLTKQGAGTLTLAESNTYSGTTVLADGTLLINGTQPLNTLLLNSGTLGGTGIVGQIIASGPGSKTINPGNGFGILTTSNLVFNTLTRLALDLNGAVPGVNHDQLNVRGTLALGNSQLLLLTGSGLASGQILRIIQNDGSDPISGTFNGLPEGATLIASNGLILHITYHGGDGNDVELRVTNPPPQIMSFGFQPTGYYRITGHGFPNLLYSLEASTTLQSNSWVSIAADLVDSQGAFELIDVDAPSYPFRFYRIQSP